MKFNDYVFGGIIIIDKDIIKVYLSDVSVGGIFIGMKKLFVEGIDYMLIYFVIFLIVMLNGGFVGKGY